MPAFTPNPAKNNRKIAACQGPFKPPAMVAKVEKSVLPVREVNSRNPMSRQPVPACDITRKRMPARRVASWRCSKLIRQYAVSAITSQAIRKKNAFEAVKTQVRLASSRL